MIILFVCLSVCLSIMTRYRSKISWDRDFRFSPYDSLESLVFCDKISSRWVKGVTPNEGEKEGHVQAWLAHLAYVWVYSVYHAIADVYKKFELMLKRRAKAYSSSGSVV